MKPHLLLPLLILFLPIAESAETWEEAKAKYQSAGNSLDIADFTPAPIPDAENYAATDFLKGITIPDGVTHPSGLDGTAARARLEALTELIDAPYDDDEELFSEWLKRVEPGQPFP